MDSNRKPVEIPTSDLFATHDNLAESFKFASDILLSAVDKTNSIAVHTALQCLQNTLGKKYDVYLKQNT